MQCGLKIHCLSFLLRNYVVCVFMRTYTRSRLVGLYHYRVVSRGCQDPRCLLRWRHGHVFVYVPRPLGLEPELHCAVLLVLFTLWRACDGPVPAWGCSSSELPLGSCTAHLSLQVPLCNRGILVCLTGFIRVWKKWDARTVARSDIRNPCFKLRTFHVMIVRKNFIQSTFARLSTVSLEFDTAQD